MYGCVWVNAALAVLIRCVRVAVTGFVVTIGRVNKAPGTIGRRADGLSPQLVEHRAYASYAYLL